MSEDRRVNPWICGISLILIVGMSSGIFLSRETNWDGSVRIFVLIVIIAFVVVALFGVLVMTIQYAKNKPINDYANAKLQTTSAKLVKKHLSPKPEHKSALENDYKICQKCREKNLRRAEICENCGSNLMSPTFEYCPSCGYLMPNSQRCKNCGYKD